MTHQNERREKGTDRAARRGRMARRNETIWLYASSSS